MSCTNVHKANLGSQLSIFDTGSFARACPCLNDPPERVDMDALKRPAQTILHRCSQDRNEGTRESQANKLHECAQSQPRVTTSHFLIRSHSPRHALARTTCPNELTRMPTNDPTERFYMGTRTTEMKPHWRAGKMSCTNVHKANISSQLSIFDMGSFAGARTHPNDPPK